MRRDVSVQFDGVHLRVWRSGRRPLSWDDLQAIKNEAAGEDALAVEVYPPQGEVVDEAPIRHLWIVSDAPSLLRRRPQGGG